MKPAFAALALSMLVLRAGGAEPETPDPKTVCLELVGTFAEAGDPRAPKQPSLAVAFAAEKFTLVDCRGKMKTEQAIPTKEGLVFVEANRDRNVYRLSCDTKHKEYYYSGHKSRSARSECGLQPVRPDTA